MHYAKYNITALHKMVGHYQRNKNCQNREEKNIDWQRTHFNYKIVTEEREREQHLTDREYIIERVNSVHHINRKDINLAVDVVLTLPRSWKGDSRDFFINSFNFLADTHGRENVVAGYVHRDETTDHMHFLFVPTLYNKEKEREELNAKKCVNKSFLQHIHKDLEHYLKEKMPERSQEIQILNGSTKKTIERVEELEKKVEYMERYFSLEINQDRDFYKKMDKYVERELQTEKDVVREDRREELEKQQQIDIERERERELLKDRAK